MRNKILIWVLVLLTLVLTSCSESTDGPIVVPPSWRGFNYVVKREINTGQSGEYEQIERGALKPGDDIKVFGVRKTKGTYVGSISGKIYVRCTFVTDNGVPVTETLEKGVTSVANSTLDGWEDPYAVFTLPTTDKTYKSFKVQVACQFYFNTQGNENSLIDYSDETSHEAPYLGHIYTDLANIHPMNGGSANSGKSGSGLLYHTIYQYSE